MSSLNIALSFKKIPLLIEELKDLIDEKLRLWELDELLESNDDIVDKLKQVVKLFKYIDSELMYNLKEYLKYKSILKERIESYGELISFLESNNEKLEIENLSQFVIREQDLQSVIQEKQRQETMSNVKTKKSVRFKESLIDPPSGSAHTVTGSEEDQIVDASKQNLFAQQQEEETRAKNQAEQERYGVEDFSNRELFIANEQEMLQQDSMLDTLSGSIQTQRQMGLTINEEVDDQMIILNDLEQMIDGTASNLERGMKGLERINRSLKLNPNWATILVLFLILLILVLI